jgi:transcriptional regulator with XRE-family HTH domain
MATAYSERIRQERDRLHLSVAEFAALCGVTARSQRNYEAGLRTPDVAYLECGAAHGVDIGFIASGTRGDAVAETIGQRLKKERRGLALTQAEFGALCGVAKTAQYTYESGTRHPDAAYLQCADALGADVLYVITGRREKEAKHAA